MLQVADDNGTNATDDRCGNGLLNICAERDQTNKHCQRQQRSNLTDDARCIFTNHHAIFYSMSMTLLIFGKAHDAFSTTR